MTDANHFTADPDAADQPPDGDLFDALWAEVGPPVARPAPPPWQLVQIGAVPDGGVPDGAPSATLLGTRLLVQGLPGSGLRDGSRTDSFGFLHQDIDGDVEIGARLFTSGYCGDSAVKLGLMMRPSLGPTAPYVLAGLTAGTLFSSQYREAAGQKSRVLGGNGTAVAGTYLRLVRRGSLFEIGFSLDGESWQSWEKSLTWPPVAQVGMAIATSALTPNCAAVFEQPRVRRLPLPRPWQQTEIATDEVGGALLTGDRFAVTGAGDNIDGGNDEFMYVHQPWSGDVQITARLAEFTGTHVDARAGIMVRSRLRSNSPAAALLIDPAGLLRLRKRADAEYSMESVLKLEGLTVPLWLRLVRRGDSFAGFFSTDGVQWTPHGSFTLGVEIDQSFVGLAVVDGDEPATAAFDQVKIELPPPP